MGSSRLTAWTRPTYSGKKPDPEARRTILRVRHIGRTLRRLGIYMGATSEMLFGAVLGCMSELEIDPLFSKAPILYV